MQSFTPVTSSKLYIQIYNQIRDAILNGSFQVGEKLPSEKEFCELFGVSRVPVREALSALELNGLVESVHGAGVYVKQVNALTNDWIQDTDPQDIIQVRMLMEPEVARAAARNISEAERRQLKEIMLRFQAEADADKYSEETDRDFHMCVASASGNHMYLVMCEMVWKAMEQKMWTLIRSRTVTCEKNRKRNYEEHMQIARAICDRDPDLAYESMKTHMKNLEERYWT